jgi:very-long-chain enoyl-CoA reductase
LTGINYFDVLFLSSSFISKPQINLVVAKCTAQPSTTIKDIKGHVYSANKKLNPHRQALRLEVRGKTLKDSDTAESLNLQRGSKLFVKDLGPQIGWSTVFMAEYAGPLLVYLWFYQRPWIFYGDVAAPISQTAQYAKIYILCNFI